MPDKRHHKQPRRHFSTLAFVTVAILTGVGIWYGVSWIVAALVAINLVTFALYGSDKRRAITERQRIPESVLHVLTAAGGTIGAWTGQRVFRHKTRDVKFRRVFFAIVGLQVIVTGLWIWFQWR